jgi:aryl-alcohol dehydrogenase-like predicted oxidoreductase
MQHRRLGRTGLDVTDIGFGALEIGRPWGIRSAEDPGLPPSIEEVARLMNRVLDLGINFIDTAAAYEDSEERIGRTIPHRRGEYYLATKFGERFRTGEGSHYDFSAQGAERFLEESLRLLKTDYVDLWQIHCGANDLETVTSEETMGAMVRAKEAGKTRFLGVSPGSVEAAMATIASGVYDTLQLTYNVYDRVMAQEVLPAAKAAGVGVIVKWPLGGGTLTSKYERLGESQAERKADMARVRAVAERHGMTLPDLALRFLLSNDAVSTIIAGTRSIEHLEANVANSGKALSPDILAEVDAAIAQRGK